MQQYYIVDLFAGCGGLSEGFRQEEFEVIADVEMDRWACETLRTRHLFYDLQRVKSGVGHYTRYVQGKTTKERIWEKHPEIREHIDHRVINTEMSDETVEDVIQDILKSQIHFSVRRINVLIGGPPCQPYSLIGRARDPKRMKGDNRHFLYRHYLRVLESIEPDFFIYENVPGLFSATTTGERVFEKLVADFRDLKTPYVVTPPLGAVATNPGEYMLLSSHFGVPQSRKRLILIGFRQDLLEQTSQVEEVFRRIQGVALRNVLAFKDRKKKQPVVLDAIGDLPLISPGEGDDGWLCNYPATDGNTLAPYQKLMRRNSHGVTHHRARTHMVSDLERYKFFIRHWEKHNKKADLRTLMEERPDLRPDHESLDKFVDRFKVQWWDKPSSTITAHIAKDGHYYIHPDVNQCRSFTAREAARCQSFPDDFFFEGPRTEQFRQIGNAVPPLMAKAIAKEIRKVLEAIHSE